MAPVRSEATQPLLPSVLPMRLLPREVTTVAPKTSGPDVAVFPATIVFVSLAVLPDWLKTPPPLRLVELLLLVHVVEVAVPRLLTRPPLPLVAELPLMVQLVSVALP